VIKSEDRFDGTNEDSSSRSFFSCDNIGTEVHPIGEVDIQVTARTEHDIIPCRTSGKAMGGRVVVPVRLDLDDPSEHGRSPKPPNDDAAKKVRGYLENGTIIECRGERAHVNGLPADFEQESVHFESGC